jgi:hypothetical protein
MSEEHKVKTEEAKETNNWGWAVIWTCTCGERFTGTSKGKSAGSDRIKDIATQRAEAAFRKHLPIR